VACLPRWVFSWLLKKINNNHPKKLNILIFMIFYKKFICLDFLFVRYFLSFYFEKKGPLNWSIFYITLPSLNQAKQIRKIWLKCHFGQFFIFYWFVLKYQKKSRQSVWQWWILYDDYNRTLNYCCVKMIQLGFPKNVVVIYRLIH